MEEKFISGYCRHLDASRTVTAECEDGRWVCDCAWPDCTHAQSCPIARQLGELAEERAGNPSVTAKAVPPPLTQGRLKRLRPRESPTR